MKTTLSLLALVSAWLLAFGALAADRANINKRTGLFEPPASDLRKASERGDRAELTREATRLGAARLARLAADSDRKLVLAALDAMPLLDDCALLLESVVPLLASPDDAIRARAVSTAALLFAQSGPSRRAEYEVAPETVSATCRALGKVAANQSEHVSTRLSAVQGLVDGGAACSSQLGKDLLSAAREPEIRRAVVLAMPATPDGKAALAAALEESDTRVASAAAARLCKVAGAKSAALPMLGGLAVAPETMAEDVVEMLPCLAASTDRAGQKAFAQLQESGRPVIRDAIKRLRETR